MAMDNIHEHTHDALRVALCTGMCPKDRMISRFNCIRECTGQAVPLWGSVVPQGECMSHTVYVIHGIVFQPLSTDYYVPNTL